MPSPSDDFQKYKTDTQETTDTTLATRRFPPEENPVSLLVLHHPNQLDGLLLDLLQFVNGFPLPEQKIISQRRKIAKSLNNPRFT